MAMIEALQWDTALCVLAHHYSDCELLIIVCSLSYLLLVS